MNSPDGASHDDFYKSLLGDFLGESEQLLVVLNENLLRLDEWARSLKDEQLRPCVDGLLADLFRAAHSFKGLSNMLGLEDIERLVDHIEKLLDAARKEKVAVTGDVVGLLFEAIDRLGNLVDALKDSDAPAVEFENVLQRINRVLMLSGAEPAAVRQQRAEETLGKIESQMAEVIKGMGSEPTQPAAPPLVTTPAEGEARMAEVRDQLVDAIEAAACVVPRSEADSIALFEELADDADMSSRFISIFIDETEMALDQLTDTLLAVERGGGSADDLKHLLVISHRIKGSAASVGLNRAAKFSHLMEDLLQSTTDAGESLAPEVTDALLKCVDELRSYNESLKQGTIPPDHFPELAIELLKARQQRDAETQAPPADRASLPETGQPVAAPAPTADTAPQPATEPSDDSGLVPISPDLCAAAIAAAPIGLPLYVGVATFQSNLALVGLKAELLHEKLSNLGDVCFFDPPPEKLDSIEQLECIRFALATERSEHEIRVALKTSGVLGSVVEPVSVEVDEPVCANSPAPADTPASPAEPTAQIPTSPSAQPTPSPQPTTASTPPAEERRSASRAADTHKRPTETLRVDVDRLDQLMNLAGQLVVSKARFAQISDTLRAVVGNKRSVLALNNVLASLARIAELEEHAADRDLLEAELTTVCAQARRIHGQLDVMQREVDSFYQMHTSINELEEAVHQLDRVADEIQKNVMDTRMVPIGPLFTRFHRVVRDITRTSGKAIRLVIHGEKTELDKRMIDELGDPLIHMVRNSADHGIESVADRQLAGKPAEGTITLDAFHRGNSILVQISDDGRGLDPDQILARAIERGIVTSRDAEQMTTPQILQLIWQPGFSTAGEVTEVSGRGVGMDIVKSRVESLNGTVELESTPGQGLTVTIKLPLTLAILPSLMVEVSGDVFAMPMESVAEIVRVRRDEIATVHGQQTVQVRGRVVSVVDLDDVFDWRSGTSTVTDRSSGLLTLVIVGEDDQEIALAIDRVIGEEDVVIKSMAENYRNVPGIAGASVLGSGRVSLILDMATVIAMAAHPGSPVTVS